MSSGVEVIVSSPDVAPARLGSTWAALARLQAAVEAARREVDDLEQAARRAGRAPARAMADLEEYLTGAEVEDPDEVARLEARVREANALVEYRPVTAGTPDGGQALLGMEPVDIAAAARVRRARARLEAAVAERDRFRVAHWGDLLVEAAPRAREVADRVNEALARLQAALGAFDDVAGAIVRLGVDTGLWAAGEVPAPVSASELNRAAAAAPIAPPLPRGVLDQAEASHGA